LALTITACGRLLSRRWGLIAQPAVDRWHKKPTALMGGGSNLPLGRRGPVHCWSTTEHGGVVLASSAFLFSVGLADDLLRLSRIRSFNRQVMGAALVVASGLTLPWRVGRR